MSISKYTCLLFIVLGAWACNEKVVVSEPKTPQPPVIYSFSPSSGTAGTLIEIKGVNLAKVETVTIGSSTLNLLKDRVTDNYIVALLATGVTTGRLTLLSQHGQVQSTSDFYVDVPFAPRVDAVDTECVVNGVLKVKGTRLAQIAGVYLRRALSDGYEDIPASFSYKSPDSIGVVVPPVKGGKVTIAYVYDEGGASVLREHPLEINIKSPQVVLKKIPKEVYAQCRFEIEGDNLNVVEKILLAGNVNTILYKDVSSAYKLILKTSEPLLAPGSYELQFFDANGEVLYVAAGSEVPRLVVADRPAKQENSVFEYVGEGLQAYVRSVTSTNTSKQYYIYELPMQNKVVDVGTADTLPLPVAGKLAGYMKLDYDVDQVVALGATITGGVAFAQVSPVTTANADVLKNYPEPVLHFWANTFSAPVTCELNVILSAGYYFSNGYKQANSNANLLINSEGRWRLFAIRLGDMAYKTGSTSYADIKSQEAQHAFYQKRIDELRLRLRTTVGASGGKELIQVATAGFFIADRVCVEVDPDVVDLTITN